MDGSRLGLKPTMTGQERKTDREKKNPEPTRKTEHNKRETEIYDVSNSYPLNFTVIYNYLFSFFFLTHENKVYRK